MTALLEAHGLSWEAGGRPVLGPLDVEVREGECLAVVGPNGAGKTTLLRMLTGILPPTGGEVLWRGEPLGRQGRRAVARRVAYVPQSRPLRIPLTVEQLVLLGRYPHFRPYQLAPTEADRDAVGRALAQVGISALADRLLEELSGGERQAAFVAAALAQEAELLVLDEPTTHLDAHHQRRIVDLLLRLHRSRRATLILATHDLHLAARLAGRILALQGGRVLTAGPPAAVLVPEVLESLFDAPFEVVRAGSRPLVVLDLLQGAE